MGDVHFILRHALTGAVFVLFAAISWQLNITPNLANNDELKGVLAYASGNGDVVLGLIACPVIGITIQGAHVCLLSLQGGLFKDPARQVIAARVKKAIKSAREDGSDSASVDWKFLEDAPEDAFFVWLYHGCAGADIIEWARRRRSYYYLGLNWVAAGVLGMTAGAFTVWLLGQPRDTVRAILVLLGLVWGGGAIWAAIRMKKDADAMEAIWAASMAHPRLRQELSCLAAHLGSRPSPR